MGLYRYEIITKPCICPNCHHTVKKETQNDAIKTGLILLFPIGIIVWCIKGILKLFDKKEFTSSGDEIVTCSNCGKKIVINKD